MWKTSTETNTLLSRAKGKTSYHLPGSNCLNTGSQNENQSDPIKCKVLSTSFVFVNGSVVSGVPVSCVANVGTQTEMGQARLNV